MQIEGGRFTATARQPVQQGWKILFDSASHKGAEEPTLPALKKDDALHCIAGELSEKMTQPPRPFTDATLLAAMTGIARHVEDPEIRKILRDTDGLGTEATRAGIIDLLFQRGFIVRQGQQIHATDAGRGLIQSLPAQATTPDMTAHWESVLEAMSQRQASYDEFMQQLVHSLQQLIAQARQTLPSALQGLQQPTRKPRRKYTKKSSARL